MRLLRRHIRLWPGRKVLILFLALLALSVIGTRQSGCRALADDDGVPLDFCYVTQVSVTNATGGTITTFPVRVPWNSSETISQGYLDARGWDVVPVTSGNAEIELMAEDLGGTASGWWIVVPSLDTGSTQTFNFYSGNNQAKRDNGMYFGGADSADAADHANFDITDTLTLTVDVLMMSHTAQTSNWARHWDTNEGYAFGLADSTGLKVRCRINATDLDVAWDTTWTDTNQAFRCRFTAAGGNDLFIDRLVAGTWTNIAAADTDIASITAPAAGPAFETGDALDNGAIRDVMLQNGSTITAHWLFNASQIAETSAVAPNYTGTVEDSGPNNHDLTYTFSRSATGISVSVGPVTETAAAGVPAFTRDVADVLGPAFGTDITTVGDESATFPLASIFDNVTDTGLPRQGAWVMLAVFIAILCLAVFTLATGRVWIGFTVGSLPLFFGVIADLYPAWVLVLWLAAGILTFGAGKWAEDQ